MTKRFTDAEWKAMPAELKRRYWSETDYGKRPPTDKTLAEMRAAVAGVEKPKPEGMPA